MSDWQRIGQQRYRIEGDLVLWEGSGLVTRAELAHLFNECAAVENRYGYALLQVDALTDLGLPPEARRFLAEFHRSHRAIGATAVSGISPVFVIGVELVLRAIQLISGKQVPTRFFRARDEARAWLLEQRPLFRAGTHPMQLALKT